MGNRIDEIRNQSAQALSALLMQAFHAEAMGDAADFEGLLEEIDERAYALDDIDKRSLFCTLDMLFSDIKNPATQDAFPINFMTRISIALDES